jgi:hypothetical protein
MADSHFIQDVPFKYMDLQTLWNDRRDPHANPMSSSPRRMAARESGGNGLAKAVEGLFHPSPFDDRPTDPVQNKRLYQDQK